MNASIRSARSPLIAISAAALVSAAALGLTGCTLDFIPQSSAPGAGAGAGAGEGAGEGAGAGAGSGIVSGSELGGDSGSGSGTDAENYTRADLEAAVERRISCPDGAIEIDDVGATIELDSDCATVSVIGHSTTLLAQNVGSLSVTGVANVVLVKQLGAVAAEGSSNYVTWDSGDPTVTDSGSANVVRPAR